MMIERRKIRERRLREAKKRAQILQRRDRAFHVFVGQVGYWLPWDPDTNKIENQDLDNYKLAKYIVEKIF